MTDVKEIIARILKGDQELRDLIGNRTSIVPAGLLTGKHKFPAITVQEGPIVRDGEFMNINEFYIRVYDEKKNGTIYIAPIGYRIMQLLDKCEMELKRGRFIKAAYMDSIGEYDDPSLNKNFVQYRYRINTV